MVELADTRDLKSLGSDTVPVQARSAAPIYYTQIKEVLYMDTEQIQRSYAGIRAGVIAVYPEYACLLPTQVKDLQTLHIEPQKESRAQIVAKLRQAVADACGMQISVLFPFDISDVVVRHQQASKLVM